MGDRRYIISETSARTGLESHVLRYWEDELGLSIPRNELGHRYYTEEHIKLFCKIKELKEKGYQLKAIKSELEGKSELSLKLDDAKPVNAPDMSDDAGAAGTQAREAESEAAVSCVASTEIAAPVTAQREPANADRLEQFRTIIGGIVTESLRENNIVLKDEISYTVSEKVIKEMDYLLRLKEESEDERFKKLDETIRSCQRSSREAAAYSEGRGWKKKRKKRG
ncbi:MAG: MerR family transcriptional regulator [Butyrivibrio sp.]|nr:MerR family transcriptional regulator [Butyrivibrio sp.]